MEIPCMIRWYCGQYVIIMCFLLISTHAHFTILILWRYVLTFAGWFFHLPE